MDPKIYLGIDNCFAAKRWTSPSEWVRVIKDIGIRYIECVPDLEIEPLMTPEAYQHDWADEVNELQAKEGVDIVMFYSNVSTYYTIGFAHPDERIREYLINKWFRSFCKIASLINADIGYYVQGFPESILYNKPSYDIACERMLECLAKVNHMTEEYGIRNVALEQMYTPHQIPFTIDAMKRLMLDVKKYSGKSLYFTEDVGHHCPFYLRPSDEELEKAYMRYCKDGYVSIWLGSKEAYNLFTLRRSSNGRLDPDILKAIRYDIRKNDHLFNEPRDTDCYAWLCELGCYSPVIHLQQSDGTHSSHIAFTPENNEKGIIHPLKVLRAIKESYDKPVEDGMPERCEDIYLIQELYLNTLDIGYQGLYRLAQSTEYLRSFIPRDGMRLSELLEFNNKKTGDI